MPPAAEDHLRPPPAGSPRPQPTAENPSTSDWSQADTVTPSREEAKPRKSPSFTMRIGIRLQLALIVLLAALLGLAVVTIATWVR